MGFRYVRLRQGRRGRRVRTPARGPGARSAAAAQRHARPRQRGYRRAPRSRSGAPLRPFTHGPSRSARREHPRPRAGPPRPKTAGSGSSSCLALHPKDRLVNCAEQLNDVIDFGRPIRERLQVQVSSEVRMNESLVTAASLPDRYEPCRGSQYADRCTRHRADSCGLSPAASRYGPPKLPHPLPGLPYFLRAGAPPLAGAVASGTHPSGIRASAPKKNSSICSRRMRRVSGSAGLSP